MHAGAEEPTRVPLRLQFGHEDLLLLVGLDRALDPHAGPVANRRISALHTVLHGRRSVERCLRHALSARLLSVAEGEHVQLRLVEVCRVSRLIQRIVAVSIVLFLNSELLDRLVDLVRVRLAILVNILIQIVFDGRDLVSRVLHSVERSIDSIPHKSVNLYVFRITIRLEESPIVRGLHVSLSHDLLSLLFLGQNFVASLLWCCVETDVGSFRRAHV